MKVSQIGEFGLIEHLAGLLPRATADVILGVGDDAAAWRLGREVLLATTDTLVENVHFTKGVWPWHDLGWKLLAINLSDIAAMGGTPLFALVTLGLPPETDIEAIDDVYAGLRECAEEYGTAVVGGDIVRASEVTLSLTLIGKAQMKDGEPLLLRRDAARPGDAIAVTGGLGDAAGGLRRLGEGASLEDRLVRAQLLPRPQLKVARRAALLDVRCAIDISDGLLQDLGHICEMSAVGAEVWCASIPISHALHGIYPEEALRLACTGGEDYQMLFVGPEEALEEMAKGQDEAPTLIGHVVDDPERKVRLLDEAGREVSFADAGWDHLKQ